MCFLLLGTNFALCAYPCVFQLQWLDQSFFLEHFASHLVFQDGRLVQVDFAGVCVHFAYICIYISNYLSQITRSEYLGKFRLCRRSIDLIYFPVSGFSHTLCRLVTNKMGWVPFLAIAQFPAGGRDWVLSPPTDWSILQGPFILILPIL